MRRILFARNQPVFEKPVDENLNMLPRNGPRSSHLWHGLRPPAIQAAQDPSTPCGGNTLAVYFAGNGPQPMKERRNLIEQAKQRSRLASIHDNHIVIMTVLLSINSTILECEQKWNSGTSTDSLLASGSRGCAKRLVLQSTRRASRHLRSSAIISSYSRSVRSSRPGLPSGQRNSFA